MRPRSFLFSSIVAAALAGAIALACGAGDFDKPSKVNSVRIFGVKPDKPFAKPGETVTLEVLATDARKEKARPLKIFWIPVVCLNPREDLYYLCFLPGAAEGGAPAGSQQLVAPFPDGGASAGGGSLLQQIPTGVDLGPFLPQGPTFSFQMPGDAIKERPGAPPYGLAIVFNVACAGQVRIADRAGANPQQVPLQCTDEAGVPLPPSDFVIGINRVYAYTDRSNTNPIVQKVTLEGVDVDPAQGLTIERCVAARRGDCKKNKIDVKVDEASWEANPPLGSSAAQREQIWVDYYSDLGDFKDDARLLFDSTKGRISESDVEYRAPNEAGEGTFWAVVHDNRAGASFVTMPLHIK